MRTRFNSSPLVRCLEGLGLADVPQAEQTLAERLGHWLDWRDAIALFGALQGTEAPAVPPSAAQGRPAAPARMLALLRDDVARVRAELERDIAEDSAFTDTGVDAATRRAHHAAHQRAMEARVAPLRERARVALAGRSPAGARLAALDALMERALVMRERQLLANVPVLLDQQATRAAVRPGQSPTIDGRALQRTLVAELALRLQSVDGLLEALASEAPAADDIRSAAHHA